MAPKPQIQKLRRDNSGLPDILAKLRQNLPKLSRRYALKKIDNFTAGLDLESFVKDDKTTFAVIRALEI